MEIGPQQGLAMKGQSGGWMDGQMDGRMDGLGLRSAKRHLRSSTTRGSSRQSLNLGSLKCWCAQRVSGWVQELSGCSAWCWVQGKVLLEQRLLWGADVDLAKQLIAQIPACPMETPPIKIDGFSFRM